MRHLVGIFLFVTVVSLGCVARSTPEQENFRNGRPVNRVAVDDEIYFKFLTTKEMNLKKVVTQRLQGIYGDRSYHCLARVESNSERLVIVGLTDFGMRLFTLTYEGKTLAFETFSDAALQISPEYLLADFQLIHAPFSLLKAHLTGKEVQFDETDQERSVYAGGKKIIEIEYDESSSAQVLLSHRTRGYTLLVETLEEQSP